MRSWLLPSVLSAVLLVGPAVAAPEPAIPELLKRADQYAVVALGQNHWSQARGRFYQSLVRTPGFAERFNTILLECGNSRYQATLDRYMNGEEVTYQEISHV